MITQERRSTTLDYSSSNSTLLACAVPNSWSASSSPISGGIGAWPSGLRATFAVRASPVLPQPHSHHAPACWRRDLPTRPAAALSQAARGVARCRSSAARRPSVPSRSAQVGRHASRQSASETGSVPRVPGTD